MNILKNLSYTPSPSSPSASPIPFPRSPYFVHPSHTRNNIRILNLILPPRHCFLPFLSFPLTPIPTRMHEPISTQPSPPTPHPHTSPIIVQEAKKRESQQPRSPTPQSHSLKAGHADAQKEQAEFPWYGGVHDYPCVASTA